MTHVENIGSCESKSQMSRRIGQQFFEGLCFLLLSAFLFLMVSAGPVSPFIMAAKETPEDTAEENFPPPQILHRHGQGSSEREGSCASSPGKLMPTRAAYGLSGPVVCCRHLRSTRPQNASKCLNFSVFSRIQIRFRCLRIFGPDFRLDILTIQEAELRFLGATLVLLNPGIATSNLLVPT